jgi:branched-chain amino acid transport system substrate-binding protein
LIDQGVVAIIGHITSAQTAAVLDQINQAEVVLMSPTSSSTLFSEQADYFFRVMPGNELTGTSLANHIFNKHGVKQLTVVYDASNQTFSETLREAIKTEFESLGGDASQVFTFTGGQNNLEELVIQMSATQPEALIFIATAIDTALMVQYSRQYSPDTLVFSSTWAQTDELLQKGGHAVEGLEMGAAYHPQHPSQAYQEFIKKFEARYRRQPGLAASHAYETVMVLAQALAQTKGQAEGLPQALTTIKNMPGLQGDISFNEYGDVIREAYIVKVKDGQFEVIDTIMPQ